VAELTNTIKSQLMEIVMAQDFQDLTGQMIKKLTIITTDLEGKLLEVLIDHAPSERPELAAELLGPNFTENAPESVANQAEVDSLLESLGF
jgi:chemotaxis protein CheZ